MVVSYAIRFGAKDSGGDSRQEQIENTLTVRSPALKSRTMAVRDILILPDKRLRLVSKPVAKIDAATRKLVEEMFETMYDAPGIGLAAIQIGEPRRVVTMDLAKKDEPKEPQVFINPELISHSAEKNVHEEGCLSIPEYYEEVERPAAVKLRYLDLDGKQHEIDADGLLATCIQHEIDHLDGVLFIDHISKLKRDRVIKKFTKAAKLGKPAIKSAAD
jgi:peptide deformylase